MRKILIWDIPTRLFHWLLVGLIFFQWLTVEILDDAIKLHMYGGYTLLGLVLFRIIWGFVGTTYARFSNFIYSLTDIIAYCRQLASKDSEPYSGHNPMGGIAVILLLSLVLLQAVSGLFITDDIFSSGPYYSAVSGQIQDIMATIHHRVFDILLIFIVIHVLTVVVYVFYKQQPIVSAMVHGKKPSTQDEAISGHQLLKAIVTAALVAGFVYGLVEVWPPVGDDYYY
jgi:cytochrome b